MKSPPALCALAATMQLGGKWLRRRLARPTSGCARRGVRRADPPWICKRRTTKFLRKKIEQTRPCQLHGYGLVLGIRARRGAGLPGPAPETPRPGAAVAAFTLVELLVVLAIIAMLAALLLPVLGRAKEEARATVCLANLHQVGLALQLYVQDNNNKMPVMWDAPTNAAAANPATTNATINQVLLNQLGNTNVLRCPSDFYQAGGQSWYALTGSSYSWNFFLNGEDADHLVVLTLPFHPDQIPVVFDKENFHLARGANKAVNYLYADGHIKNLLAIAGTQ